MLVPVAASMRTGRDGAFARALQDAVDAAGARTTGETRRAVDPAPSATEPGAAAPVPDRAAADEPAAVATGGELTATDRGEIAPVAIQTADPSAARLGGDLPRSDAGKSSASSPGATEPAAAPDPAPVGVTQSHAQLFAVQAPAPNASSSPAAARGAEPFVRGVDGPAFRAGLPARAQAVHPGYATNRAASAELLEQARDSVFKQILMRLTAGGGELRLRLEPPDLGELDLRLVVEGGNRLSLSIQAERADIALLLQRHLEELKHTLQQHGLDVTGAEVGTRTGSGSNGAPSSGDDQPASDDASEQSASRPQFGGYVAADGLDFWA